MSIKEMEAKASAQMPDIEGEARMPRSAERLAIEQDMLKTFQETVNQINKFKEEDRELIIRSLICWFHFVC